MNNTITPAIVEFPASNCMEDMKNILKSVYSLDPLIIWHERADIPKEVTHVILPGGFSYGDYLRAGVLAAHSPIMNKVKQFAHAGGLVLGICNGFQILCESNLLPGVLLENNHHRFVCSVQSTTWFGATKKLSAPMTLKLPIAHKEGRYFADKQTLEILQKNNQIILVYDDIDEQKAAVANGSTMGIAGIVGGPANNIIGMMPHPERMAQKELLGTDGCLILNDFLFGQQYEQ